MSDDRRVDPAESEQADRARAFAELYAVLSSLPERFPDAYGGQFVGPTNNDVTIQVVDGAAGADEMIAAVRHAEQRSLDQVGVSFRFHFETVTITHTQLDQVRASLTEELSAQDELFELGMTGVGLAKSCVSVYCRRGTSPTVRAAVEARHPDVPFTFAEVVFTRRRSTAR